MPATPTVSETERLSAATASGGTHYPCLTHPLVRDVDPCLLPGRHGSSPPHPSVSRLTYPLLLLLLVAHSSTVSRLVTGGTALHRRYVGQSRRCDGERWGVPTRRASGATSLTTVSTRTGRPDGTRVCRGSTRPFVLRSFAYAHSLDKSSAKSASRSRWSRPRPLAPLATVTIACSRTGRPDGTRVCLGSTVGRRYRR
ncbi:hypothetical protein SAMN04487950_1605 [Halogranum rubrum]|uniref:Uncharacterized protein n=1 Tax=Halogranum rubrum TaxID=553466 RepID=A0A1I4D7B4_9EURY|nr:hypothetical protein SAMN04487950_1605 [Halogranum rubrum]